MENYMLMRIVTDCVIVTDSRMLNHVIKVIWNVYVFHERMVFKWNVCVCAHVKVVPTCSVWVYAQFQDGI